MSWLVTSTHAILTVGLTVSAPAFAEAPVLRFTQLNALRYEPIGMESQNTALVRAPLWTEQTSELFGDCGVGAGLSAKLNPAFPSVGPSIEITPLAVLVVRAGMDLTWFAGGFGYLQSWPDASDPGVYVEENREATADDRYATTATRTWIEPMIQAKVWRIAARSTFGVEHWRAKLEDGDTVFYAGSVDSFVPNRGFVLTDHTDLLYVDGPLVVGARWSGVWPMVGAEDRQQGSHTRVGPLFAYSPPSDRGADVTLFAVAGWYLSHPNRGGPVPYTAAGVSWTLDVALDRR